MIRVSTLFFVFIVASMPASAQKQLVLSTHNTAVNLICSKILLEAYQQLGIKIKIEKFPSKRALFMSNSGQVDGEVCRVEGIDEDYSHLIRVPVTLQSRNAVVFTKKHGLSISGWHDLKPHKIGILRGAELAKQKTAGMVVHSATTIEQLFHMLDKGRVDVVVMERIMGMVIIKKLELEGVSIVEPALVTFNLYHYLHNNQAALIPALVKVLQEMKISRIKEIQEQLYSELLQKSF